MVSQFLKNSIFLHQSSRWSVSGLCWVDPFELAAAGAQVARIGNQPGSASGDGPLPGHAAIAMARGAHIVQSSLSELGGWPGHALCRPLSGGETPTPRNGRVHSLSPRFLSIWIDGLLSRLGTFSKEGTNTCLGCPAGTYSNNILSGASSCSPCPLGAHSDAGSSKCYVVCENPSVEGGCCPAGYFSLPQSPHCHPCSPGTYSIYGTVSSCSLCKEGEYQPASAATSCLRCEHGTSSQGAQSCLLHPLKESSRGETDTNVKYGRSFFLLLLSKTIRGTVLSLSSYYRFSHDVS